jgi:hypothetical protein
MQKVEAEESDWRLCWLKDLQEELEAEGQLSLCS